MVKLKSLLSMDFWCNMCIKLRTVVLTNFEDFLNHRNIGPTCNVAFLFGQELVQEKKEAARAAAIHANAALVVEVAGLVSTMQEKPGPFAATPESPTISPDYPSNRSSRFLISQK